MKMTLIAAARRKKKLNRIIVQLKTLRIRLIRGRASQFHSLKRRIWKRKKRKKMRKKTKRPIVCGISPSSLFPSSGKVAF